MKRISRRQMLHHGRAVSIAAMSLPAWSRGLMAQTGLIGDIALYKGADRQQILEDGARREAQMTLYTNGANMRPIVEAFQKKYPYLEVALVRASSGDLTRKFLEEYGAGTYVADVIEVSTVGLTLARSHSFLQPFFSPEKQYYDSIALGPDDCWVTDREGYTGLAFNTKKIPEAEAPRTYADLLDPEWKGRMALPEGDASANWLGALLITEGEDYIHKLGQQDIRVYDASSNAIANLIVSGEIDMSPAIYLSQAQTRRDDGGAIQWAPLGPVAVLEASIALPARTEHPHAALLYLDFVLSTNGQLVYRKLDYLSSRKGMPPIGIPPLDKVFVGNRPNYLEEFEQWNTLFHDIFVHGEPKRQ